MLTNQQDLLNKFAHSEISYLKSRNSPKHYFVGVLNEFTEYVDRYNTYNREILTVPQELIDICK